MTASEIIIATVPFFGGFVLGVFLGMMLAILMKKNDEEEQEGKSGDN